MSKSRILVKDLKEHVGKSVDFSGWIHSRRDHGKIIFFDVRDRSSMVQCVVVPNAEGVYKQAKTLKSEDIVNLRGLVKERPGSAVNADDPTGAIEVELETLEKVGGPVEELPIDISLDEMKLNLDTLLNYRHLSLRNPKVQSIFDIYATLLEAYATHMRQAGFHEIKTPKLLSSATEGGANFFKVKYFDREAFLAQSPQFYKQAGVSIFERVFEVGPVFRAEHHYTSRHVNEYVGLDAEMGFIDGFEDVMDALEAVLGSVMKLISDRHSAQVALHEETVPEMTPVPRMKLVDALEILEKEFGKRVDGVDIDPEGERMICQWAQKQHGSEFLFLTHYPVKARPFYTMPDDEDPQYTKSFDLLFRGLEIATGGQRIHDYEELVKNIEYHDLNPVDYQSYLDIFKYGIPPHGGWGLGSERIVQQLLRLASIKQAVLYPRDVKRLTP